jgi:hypothetical protein
MATKYRPMCGIYDVYMHRRSAVSCVSLRAATHKPACMASRQCSKHFKRKNTQSRCKAYDDTCLLFSDMQHASARICTMQVHCMHTHCHVSIAATTNMHPLELHCPYRMNSYTVQ